MKARKVETSKLKLNDGTEIEIESGASLSRIEVGVENYEGLDAIEKDLKKAGNLDKVQFLTGDEVTGEYTYMVLSTPTYKVVQKNEDGTVSALFGLNSMDPTQKKLIELEKQMAALQELVDKLTAGK